MDTSLVTRKGVVYPRACSSASTVPSHASGAAGQIRMSTNDYDLLLPVESPRESGAISLASLGVSPFLQRAWVPSGVWQQRGAADVPSTQCSHPPRDRARTERRVTQRTWLL